MPRRGALSVDAARLRTLAVVRPVADAETLTLAAAQGRVCADAGPARVDLRPFDNSAMDGYALRVAEGPWVLPVAGRIAAGDARTPVLPAGSAGIRKNVRSSARQPVIWRGLRRLADIQLGAEIGKAKTYG
jgi:molybdopterin biosynthesis enzyme